VTEKEVREFKTYLGQEGDGLVSVDMQSLFGVFLSLSTAQGLAGARDASQPPPSDGNWLDLYKNSTFTLLPPALMDSVPCDPPVTNRQIFLGAFAAIVAIGSGSMLAVLASIPLVLLGGFFYILAGVVVIFMGSVSLSCETDTYGQCGRDSGGVCAQGRCCSSQGWCEDSAEWLSDCGGRNSWYSEDRNGVCSGSAPPKGGHPAHVLALRGTKAFKGVPAMFSNVFTKVANKIYHKLRPSAPAMLCPRGLLFLNGGPPVCISEMDKLEAKRYKCPNNESRSVVVSCEDEFNGLVVVRGTTC